MNWNGIIWFIAFIVNLAAYYLGAEPNWIQVLLPTGLLTFLAWTLDFDDDDDIVL